jgi:hypothetical protein
LFDRVHVREEKAVRRREMLGMLGVGAVGSVAVSAADDPPAKSENIADSTHTDCLKACTNCMTQCERTFHHCAEQLGAGHKEHARAALRSVLLIVGNPAWSREPACGSFL